MGDNSFVIVFLSLHKKWHIDGFSIEAKDLMDKRVKHKSRFFWVTPE